MSELRDGSHVSYLGDGSTGRVVGEHGQVLYITGSAGHVKWADRQITLEDLHDLAPLGSATAAASSPPPDALADSLEVGFVAHLGTLGVFHREGSPGVVHMLASEGKLTTFPDVAKETLRFVESRVRNDPALRTAVSSLDPDDADQVFMTAARTLLRDAFGSA